MKLPKSLQDILNQSEKALFDALQVNKLEKLSAQQIKRLQVRARKLHKKYSDLLRKQSRNLKNAAVNSANSNLRTLKKVDILEDAVKFVEKHLDLKTSKTKPKKAVTSKTKSDKAKILKKASPLKSAAPTTSKKARVSRSKAPKNTALKTQNRKIQTHQKAAGKRHQARKDRR
jgi:hypothetical protein